MIVGPIWELSPLVIAVHLLVGFPVALLFSNASEWFIHKYLLHRLGKRKNSFWHYHWGDHHQASRKNRIDDPDYQKSLFSGWDAQSKEAFSLVLGATLIIPCLWFAPGFALGLVYSNLNYYFRHKKAHLDFAWARKNLPWHVDHHLGRNQDANWCVTRPWFDILMGTRIPYVGTELEKQDLERIESRKRTLSSQE